MGSRVAMVAITSSIGGIAASLASRSLRKADREMPRASARALSAATMLTGTSRTCTTVVSMLQAYAIRMQIACRFNRARQPVAVAVTGPDDAVGDAERAAVRPDVTSLAVQSVSA